MEEVINEITERDAIDRISNYYSTRKILFKASYIWSDDFDSYSDAIGYQIENGVVIGISVGGSIPDKSGRSYDGCEEFFNDITQFKHLRYLKLVGSFKYDLPDWIFNIAKLRWLSLLSNNPISVPDRFNEMMQLEYLDLNGVKNLPSSIRFLQRLSHLSIRNTPLYEIPSWIQHLKNLSSLELGHILARELPTWIRNLRELTCLNLDTIPLIRLPDFLLYLPKLRHLYADKEVIAASSKAIQARCRELSAQEDFEMIYIGEEYMRIDKPRERKKKWPPVFPSDPSIDDINYP